MERLLVTGATGAVGPTVVERLLTAGYAVRLFVRSPLVSKQFPAAVEYAYGDITNPAAVSAAMVDCQAAVHMAALLHINHPDARLRTQYEAVNIGGTANLIQAAQAHKLRRVIFFSTIAVYGYSGNTLLTESSHPTPDTLYGETKLAAERIVANAYRPDGAPLGVILRLAAVYGARVKGNYQRLYHALARKRFFLIGRGANRRTLVYDRDVAAAALLALQQPQAAGRIYNVTDGSVHTLQEIITAISVALGQRPPRLHMPVLPVQVLVGLVEDTLTLVGRSSPLGRATLGKYLEEIVVDGSRLQKELGFIPTYSLRDGWREIIQETKDSAWLTPIVQ